MLGADGHSAQWDDIIPRGTNDWATSLLWLRRLPCRCIAACFLLCVTTVLTLLTALTGGPAREKPTQLSQTLLCKGLYYLCNLNPINSKPTQSSSTRRGAEEGEGVCLCVRREAEQQGRSESHHLSRFIQYFLAPFVRFNKGFAHRGGEFYLLISPTLPR